LSGGENAIICSDRFVYLAEDDPDGDVDIGIGEKEREGADP